MTFYLTLLEIEICKKRECFKKDKFKNFGHYIYLFHNLRIWTTTKNL